MNGNFDRYEQTSPTYDASIDSYRLDYDPNADLDVVALAILAVSDLGESESTDLPPLGERVDYDDLLRAIRLRDEGEVSFGDVTFSVADWRVTVTTDATIRIETPSAKT